MNKISIKKWCGVDLSPLPYESTYSALIRFAWRNALSPSELFRLCSERRTLYRHSLLYPSAWFNKKSLFSDIGWTFPCKEESYYLEKISDVLDVFFSSQLRLCPLCAECGYHSFWYQFLPLAYCPIHFCPLEKTCQSCNANLPQLFFSKELLARPYHCNHCGGPIAGVFPSTSGHIDFRDHAETIKREFQRYADWCANSEGRLIFLRGIKKNHDVSSDGWNLWCRPSDFFIGVACIDTPLPEGSQMSPFHALTVLRWRVNMAELPIPVLLGAKGMRIQRMRIHRANQVYRCTLSQLQRWLRARCSVLKRTISPMCFEYPEDCLVYVKEWDSFELAYVLLRTYLDHRTGDRLSWDVRLTYLKDMYPARWMPSVNGMAPRLAWRAVFLAIFAIFFHAVERSRAIGYLDLSQIHVDVDDLIAQFCISLAPPLVEGGVVFPAVNGLPLFPFDRGFIGSDGCVEPFGAAP